MDKHDAALDALLDTYTVPPAPDALLAGIFREAASTAPLPARPHWRMAGAGLMAASALLGFWLGAAQPAATGAPDDEPLDFATQLLSPTTINEVML